MEGGLSLETVKGLTMRQIRILTDTDVEKFEIGSPSDWQRVLARQRKLKEAGRGDKGG